MIDGDSGRASLVFNIHIHHFERSRSRPGALGSVHRRTDLGLSGAAARPISSAIEIHGAAIGKAASQGQGAGAPVSQSASGTDRDRPCRKIIGRTSHIKGPSAYSEGVTDRDRVPQRGPHAVVDGEIVERRC